MAALAVRYVVDQGLQAAANARGENYGYAYAAEILDRLGVCAQPLALKDVAEPLLLAQVGVLLLGDVPASALPPGAAAALTHWVRGGGVLIGFASAGLDDLFGVAFQGDLPQATDPYAINGYFTLADDGLSRGCRAALEPTQKLLIIAPIRRVRTAAAEEVAPLFLCDPQHPDDGRYAVAAGAPAITARHVGAGYAFYFAFNVAQTMWAIQQGRPIDRDIDGDGYLRVSDACVIGQNSRALPYTDALHFLLATMIGRLPVPAISPIPPRHGEVSPALLFFGGDDEGEPHNQLCASDFMASLGLPYHINLMPKDGRFAITPAEQARIEANGHELALHYNFMDGFQHPCGFRREDVLSQAALFRATFGRDSQCSVAHWCRWVGWAEPARWMREAGGVAENQRIHWTSPPLNPVNCIGFAFGSAFPRYYWDDAAHGNARVDFLSLPIVAYEVGYEQEHVFSEKIQTALELAMQYHLTLNFFYHPVYVAQFPACRQALGELVGRISSLPVPPVLMGPDRLARWWLARSRATIADAQRCGAAVTFEAECSWEDGFVVRLPTGASAARSCCVDGVPVAVTSVVEFGQHWAQVPLSPGRHRIRADL